uniref:Uncharacterized protein n=1 Tax=Plectus sambesii TaxID=2011161 RepID=A0A914W330_9BILA
MGRTDQTVSCNGQDRYGRRRTTFADDSEAKCLRTVRGATGGARGERPARRTTTGKGRPANRNGRPDVPATGVGRCRATIRRLVYFVSKDKCHRRHRPTWSHRRHDWSTRAEDKR